MQCELFDNMLIIHNNVKTSRRRLVAGRAKDYHGRPNPSQFVANGQAEPLLLSTQIDVSVILYFFLRARIATVLYYSLLGANRHSCNYTYSI